MKRRGEPLSGVLVLDKASGPGSTQSVAKVKYLLNAQKAGHGGTLDPMASGVLPILLGHATRFADDLLDANKTYEATLKLGEATDSADAMGKVINTSSTAVSDQDIRAVCSAFVGAIEQVPPMYSALKRNGKPLYEYARQGIELALEPRKVTVYSLEITAITQPLVCLRVHCSKGTYIRSLARDIGERLGCLAHLSALKRTQVGPLSLENSVGTERLESMTMQQRREVIFPMDYLLQTLQKVTLVESLALRFVQGQRISLEEISLTTQLADLKLPSETMARFRVYDEGNSFLGLARIANHTLLPFRVIAAATNQFEIDREERHDSLHS